MNNKKKILAIVLVIVVLLLGGASIYVATQLSTRKAVAPTAPESKPAASESAAVNWVGCDDCNATGAATEVACVPSGTVTCDPDCPTECGKSASTITTCTDSCGDATTKECAATAACDQDAVLVGSKTAFKNVTSNTPGKYTLTTEMDAVSKSQIFVYTIEVTNTSEVTANGVTVKDSIKDLTMLTYMDAVSDCSFNDANKELTCSTTVKPDETKKFSFRVKASDGLINGDVITNEATVTADNADTFTVKKDLAVSTVVGCNHTCTADEECGTGLKCDTTTGKCRNEACLTEEDCTCAVVVTTTTAPTTVKTVAPTKVVTVAEATPTTLPETGILDLPGVAAFGGGLFLAVVGILLAL